MPSEKIITELKLKAKQLRKDVLDQALEEGECHLGGSFSEIEILISLLRFGRSFIQSVPTGLLFSS